MRRSARGRRDTLDPWPGYVDALSTLLMVIIFVLLVFVLAQAFLSVALSGRDKALEQLNRQMAEMTDLLSLERGKSTDLQLSVSQLTRDLAAATASRDDLSRQLAALRANSEQALSQRDSLVADRDRLAAQLSDARASRHRQSSKTMPSGCPSKCR